MATKALIIPASEGQTIEFKESVNNIEKEMVAFANAAGGRIYIGVNDAGEITGTNVSNKVLSQIQDIARNCDPAINIEITNHSKEKVIEIIIDSGGNKPYRCKDGFFLRQGSSSQKLKRDEIVQLISQSDKFHYDELYNTKFDFSKDFSVDKFNEYCQKANIDNSAISPKKFLLSLNVAKEEKKILLLKNAAVLFFARDPQEFFKEGYIVCVKYQGLDKVKIIDRKNIIGDPLQMIEQALEFVSRNTSVEYDFKNGSAQRIEIRPYPLVAVREAIVNAVAHRDYYYDASCIYLHLYSDRFEIENPGGLIFGLSPENFGKHSARRNRLISDLLFRAGYIEGLGSGIPRIEQALAENNNPPFEWSSTNFFIFRFYKRVNTRSNAKLTARQLKLCQFIDEQKIVTSNDCAIYLNISADTALRELKKLIAQKIVAQSGENKSTTYHLI